MRRRYRATLRSETTKPSFNSSPWILGAPQSAFSCAKRRISTRISSLIFGRPLRGPRTPTPVESETSAVPANYGRRLHDDEDVGPARPTAAQGSPEESVERVQDRPRPFAFEHGDLV